MEKTRHYGVPYKGSKNKIVKRLMERVPSASHFYDLFCGGCAVTHRAIEEHRFAHIHANDLDGDGLCLFIDAANGKFRNERRWISREQFFAEKDTDPYISLCWSFGNNQRDYMYSREVEPYKRAAHEAVMHGDFALLEELFPGLTANLTPPMSRMSALAERHFFFVRSYDSWWRNMQNGGVIPLCLRLIITAMSRYYLSVD